MQSQKYVKEIEENTILAPEVGNNAYQSSYKESRECKTSALHGLGYLLKRQTHGQQMKAQLEEQARASAIANQKNIRLEAQVERLEEQLANEAAENARKLEESKKEIQEEEEKREELKESLRADIMQEVLSMLAEQRQEPLLHVIYFNFVFIHDDFIDSWN